MPAPDYHQSIEISRNRRIRELQAELFARIFLAPYRKLPVPSPGWHMPMIFGYSFSIYALSSRSLPIRICA